MTPDIITKPCLVLVGPTAIGKTDLSLTISRRFDCEIISVDSMQVYKYMDIGTAKATKSERAEIPHHLIDIVDPDDNYDAARFANDSLRTIREIHSRGKIPLLTGGTGLYLKALFDGIFPGVPMDETVRNNLKKRLLTEGSSKLHEELSSIDSHSAKRIHVNDSQRLLRALEVWYVTKIPWSEHLKIHKNQKQGVVFKNAIQIGLTTDRNNLYQRINKRCDSMLEHGLEDEVRQLLAMGYDSKFNSLGSIGYRHIINYIEGNWTKEETAYFLARDTRRYAKRQYTWFSRLQDLQWFDITEKQKILKIIQSWLTQQI